MYQRSRLRRSNTGRHTFRAGHPHLTPAHFVTRRHHARVKALGDALSIAQAIQVDLYLDFLLEENEKYNLTAVCDREAAYERHVLDSLALLRVIDDHVRDAELRRLHVLDVGSGPGLPGCILAIARPTWKVTCMDSIRKRTNFVTHAAGLAGIHNVRSLNGRSEDLAHEGKLREKFDIVIARAVAETRVLAEYCLPFTTVDGYWIAAKGPDVEEEVSQSARAVATLGGKTVRLEPVQSFSDHGQRTALVVKKVSPTPEQYPRAAGMPRKRPL